MASLNIVLVEPEIPQNTGNIARTCACTGANLHIVKPMGFTVTDKNLKRSGLDYWHFLNITYYENQKKHSDTSYPDNCFLLFGKETKGLPEELLIKNPERCVRIPMMDECRSLNLSNSVAIAVYETLRQWDYPELLCSGELHNYKWKDINNI